MQGRAPFHDSVIEQFKHQAGGYQFLFLNYAAVIAFKRLLNDAIDLPLHAQQFGIGFCSAHFGISSPKFCGGG